MYLDYITVVSFVWIQWTNNFTNSISVNVKVGKPSYSSKDLIIRDRAVICNRSTLFSEKVIEQDCFD